MAKQGQMDAVKIMAKDLVRTRRYVKKFMLMRANIQAVSLKIQTLKSQNAMAQAMKGVTKAMMNMNKQMKLPEIQKIMQEFEEESDAIVSQVLDELGLQMGDQISGLPGVSGTVGASTAQNKAPVAAAEGAGGELDADADLEARLNNLRRE